MTSTETRTVQERAREHSKYIGCDPRSTRLLTEAADRIETLEKALKAVDEWASDKSKFNERSVIAQVRAALSPPSDNSDAQAGSMR